MGGRGPHASSRGDLPAGSIIAFGVYEHFRSDEFLFHDHYLSTLDGRILEMRTDCFCGQDPGDHGFGYLLLLLIL